MRFLPVLLLGASLAFVSCDKGKQHDHGSHDHHAAKEMAAKAGPGPLVEVPKDGKRFEPPIQSSQLPAGVWYCDMGTVEYARGEQGDGRCPICRMRLKQKVAEAK